MKVQSTLIGSEEIERRESRLEPAWYSSQSKISLMESVKVKENRVFLAREISLWDS